MRTVLRTLIAVAASIAGSTPAWAFDSVEGASLGDQTPYFDFGGAVFFFPQSLVNIDNRVVLQLGSAANGYANLRPEQRANGVGLSIEPLEGVHFGFWVSEYQNTLASSFLTGGATQTPFGSFSFDGVQTAIPGWGTAADSGNGAAPPDLGDVDAATVALGTNQNASRKADLFFGLQIDETLNLGGRLWFGSQNYSITPDDSLGPIDIDTDGQVGTGSDVGSEQQQAVQTGTYGNSDLGLAIGAQFSGVPDLTIDGSAEINLIGIDWSPNGTDFVSAGGLGYGVNAKGMFDVSDTWTFGGFARYAKTGVSFEPTRRLDGGDLFPAFQNPDADTAGSLPNPSRGAAPGADPNAISAVDPGITTVPVQGTTYSASQSEVHLAAAGEWNPNSIATLYGSLGLRLDNYSDELEVGSFWSDKQSVNFTTRFMNLGVAGHVFSWMDIRIGASRRWTSATAKVESRDDRIPNNTDGQGPVGTPVTDGNEANTNQGRRSIETQSSVDLSNQSDQTRLSVGALIHYRGFQVSGELDQGFLTEGLNFISGSSNPLYVWVNFIYDWDYEQDARVGFGDGTRRPDPHAAMTGTSASEYSPSNRNTRGGESSNAPSQASEDNDNPFDDDDEFRS